MKKIKKSFLPYVSRRAQSGNMLTEMLMAIALAAIMIPMIVRQESARTREIENAAAVAELSGMRDALGRYISAKQDELFKSSASVFKVDVSDLADYGLGVVPKNDVQLRIAKQRERNGRTYLQGMVIIDMENSSLLRTHEIAQSTGGTAGVVKNAAHWRATFGDNSVSDLTDIVSNESGFLRRRGDGAASVLKTDLDMSGHGVENVKKLDTDIVGVSDVLSAENATAVDVLFDGMVTLSGASVFDTFVARGNLSSDGAAIVADDMSLNGVARFKDVLAYDLHTDNLSLNGISDGTGSELMVSGAMDVADGRISAGEVAVGFSGSVTPHLTVTAMLSDAHGSQYFWDLSSGRAVLNDVSLGALVPMARSALKSDSAKSSARDIMARVAANSNATAADFLNALDEIENVVRAKYNQLPK